jgi:dipeptidase D
MMTFVETLEPQQLWRHFDQILTIPRGSGNEAACREHIIGIAERNGLEYKVDGMGNLVVRKPGTDGFEDAPTVVLQNHLDMVNEKNSDVDHDFEKDAIQPERDGDYLTAVGTTLGADNGIGIAAALAVLEADDMVHGPLEFLFTVDEETGLTGAAGLDASMISGRTLLNMDSEEEGILYVGCAGGGDSALNVPVQLTEAPAGCTAVDIKLRGLKGGHSGCDIHLQRGNAIKLIVRAILTCSSRITRLNLAGLKGGSAHNAIPREAFATVVLAEDDLDAFRSAFEKTMAVIADEFRPAEPDMTSATEVVDAPGEMWDDATTATVLRLVTVLPHGAMAMSYDIPDLVETSTNLATVSQNNGTLEIGLSSRSSVESALKALRQRIRAAGELVGATVVEGDSYPGWKPNLESPLLKTVSEIHARVLGSEPEIKAIHAGLECGIIGEKLEGMDMISLGPQIEFPHSPDERVKIDSVGEFFRLLSAVLADLAKGA